MHRNGIVQRDARSVSTVRVEATTEAVPSRAAILAVGDAAVCVIIPAFDAAASIRAVLHDVARQLACDPAAVIVVDDGSTDGTAEIARQAGARVVRCSRNGGKGAALVRGFEEASALGFRVALTVDADGQHPAESAAQLLFASNDPRALVLGVRNLARDGAPAKNRFSNGVSNFFLSVFAGRRLRDTQCGLRRYPVAETLSLGTRASGFAFEAEVLLRFIAHGTPVVEHPVRVVYPPESERVTHFDGVRDPMRIIVAVVRTVFDVRRRR